MGVTALGWTNLVTTATMSANSAALNMGPGNLQSDQCSPSTGWQTVDGVTTLGTGALIKATWPTAQQTVRAVALVGGNFTPSAVVNVALWNTTPTVVQVAGMNVSPIAGYGQVVAVFAQDYLCDFVQVFINDATNPDNHINVGGMFAGPLWIPTQGMTWETTFDRAARTQETTSRGGQEWPVYLSQQRTRNFTLGNLRGSELLQQQDLLRVSGYGGNVLLVPNISAGASVIARDAIFGRLKAAGGAGYPVHNPDRFTWGAAVTERL